MSSSDFWYVLAQSTRGMREIHNEHSNDNGRRACELLNLGPGCRDQDCDLYGFGTVPGFAKTSHSCHCLSHLSDISRYALTSAIRAAARVLEDAAAKRDEPIRPFEAPYKK